MFSIFAVLCVVFSTVRVFCLDRPTIGILTQPTSSQKKESYSFIAGSYVKWVESAGAKVIPILYDWSKSKLEEVFGYINGLVIQGGNNGQHLYTDYMKTQVLLYNLSLADSHDYFPIWGTCAGFEALLVITANDYDVLRKDYDAEGLSLPLIFKVEPAETKMLKDVSEYVLDILENENVTLNHHHGGIDMETFNKHEKISKFYTAISINYDRNGKDFVSLIEGKEYPIYGSQFHPEKVAFEDEPSSSLVQTYKSVLANGVLTNMFFVEECRKNKHRFKSSEQEEEYLIYNFDPVYTGKGGGYYSQMYYFEKSSENS